VVVPLSTGPRPRPPLVVAMPSVGQDAVAVCDQLRALDKSRLTRRQGLASDADMIGLEDGLRETLGL
jgi:mRNA interferase MazF